MVNRLLCGYFMFNLWLKWLCVCVYVAGREAISNVRAYTFRLIQFLFREKKSRQSAVRRTTKMMQLDPIETNVNDILSV